jgi:hypothetical protein
MKNLHLILTDKPSRLFKANQKLFFDNINPSTKCITAQHIYITSDKEIKEGDWIIRDNEQPTLVTPNFFWDFGVRYYKIILTTDQDLIKDGVQAIDDEFLEWFIKNPSCEEVEIADLWKDGTPSAHDSYQIIIPKEESKQEILEEAAKGYSERHQDVSENLGKYLVSAVFQDGAKWQAERMYSEDEVIEILNKREKYTSQSPETDWFSISKWFEQFKKK